MKTEITNIKKNTVMLIIVTMLLFVFLPDMYAQVAMPNVKVNSGAYYDVSLDGGGRLIAVLNDTVYAVWQGKPTNTTSNIYFAKSTDGGLTFTPDLNIYSGPSTTFHAFPSIAVAQNGNIYVAWTAITNNENEWDIWAARSIDGGSTFQTPIQITTTHSYMYPCIGAYGDNVYILYVDGLNYPCADYYFVRSTNNGQSFGIPLQINDSPCTGTITDFETLTTITIDASGKIYLAWVDARRTSGNADIYFAKSEDNGQSFSTNVMVNDINQPGADSSQFSPSIAVDGSNNVYVSFTDKRLGDDWSNNRVYIAKSTDGGSTFNTESLLAGHNGACKNHSITASLDGKLFAAMCNFNAPHWRTWLYESIDGGSNFSSPIALSDTFNIDFAEIGIVLNTNELLFAMWLDDRETSKNIYLTKTDMSTLVPRIESDNDYNLYPNPASNSFSVLIPQNNKDTEITIYDMQGQIIYNKLFGNISNVNIGFNMPKGIYFVAVRSDDEIKTLKLIKN